MKTSNVIASVLFSTMALAAPLDRRAYATKTEVKVEYYTVYTTVTGVKPAAATSDPALFYESKPETAVEQPATAVTTSPAAPVIEPEPTTNAPPAPVPTTLETKPEPSTTSVYTPPPAAPTKEAPAPPPVPTQAPPKPAPVEESKPPAPEPEATESTGSGQTYKGGSYTMNYYGGGTGACGDPIKDTDMAVALAVDVFGDATVNPQTGKTTNPWCGKKIEVSNNGKTAIAFIKDRCKGCTNGGLDATPSLWEATTGGLGGGNGDRIYSMSWKVVS